MFACPGVIRDATLKLEIPQPGGGPAQLLAISPISILSLIMRLSLPRLYFSWMFRKVSKSILATGCKDRELSLRQL